MVRVEAKNDNLKDGLAQCIAETVAAQLFNQADNNNVSPVYGIVTTGSRVQFMSLAGDHVEVDATDYNDCPT